MDIAEFEAKVDQYYQQYPEQRPPPPTPAARPITSAPSDSPTLPDDHPVQE